MSTRTRILMALTAALLALPTAATAKRSPRPEDLSSETIAERRANLHVDVRALAAEARRADWLGNRATAYEKLRVVEWLLGADVKLAREQARRATTTPEVDAAQAEVTRIVRHLVQVRRAADRLRPPSRIAEK